MQVDNSKIGTYAIVIGLILIAIFLASGEGWGMALGYFLAGLVLVLLGSYIFFRSRKPADPNTARFRTLRKYRERKEKREEEQGQRKKQ
jgi:O-antigen/teichoic acid export membrane protein